MADKRIEAEAKISLSVEELKRETDRARKIASDANKAATTDTKKSAEAQAKAVEKAARQKQAAEKRAADAATREARRIEREAVRAANRTAAETKRSADKRAKDEKTAADKRVREQQRAESAISRKLEQENQQRLRADQQYQERLLRQHQNAAVRRFELERRASERSTRLRQREAEKAQREEMRASEQRAKKNAERSGSFRRGAGMAVAGGAIMGAATAASQGRSMAGVDSVETRVAKSNDAQKRLIVLGNDAGMSQEQIAGMLDRVNSVSKERGTDISQLVSGLEDAHGRFNLLNAALKDLGNYDKTAIAKGIDFGDLVNMMGSAKSAFGLKDEDIPAAMAKLIGGASVGAIGGRDFAGVMAPAMGQFAMSTGLQGVQAVEQFSGFAQGIGAGQYGAEKSEHRMVRLLEELNDQKVVAKLKNIGVNVRNKDGVIDVGSVIAQLDKNKKFENAGVRQEIFRESLGRQGIETLIAARRRVANKEEGAIDFDTVKNVDESVARESTEKALGMMENANAFGADRERARMQADTTEHLKSYNDAIVLAAKSTNNLQLNLDALSEKLGGPRIGSGIELGWDTLTSAGVGALGSWGLSTLLGGGAAAAGGAGAAAAGAGTAAAGIGAAGAAGGAAAVGGAALAWPVALGALAVGGGAYLLSRDWSGDDGAAVPQAGGQTSATASSGSGERIAAGIERLDATMKDNAKKIEQVRDRMPALAQGRGAREAGGL